MFVCLESWGEECSMSWAQCLLNAVVDSSGGSCLKKGEHEWGAAGSDLLWIKGLHTPSENLLTGFLVFCSTVIPAACINVSPPRRESFHVISTTTKVEHIKIAYYLLHFICYTCQPTTVFNTLTARTCVRVKTALVIYIVYVFTVLNKKNIVSLFVNTFNYVKHISSPSVWKA